MEVHRPAASPRWIDIDSADMENPMACTDYAESIMNHLYQAEVCPDLSSLAAPDVVPTGRCMVLCHQS